MATINASQLNKKIKLLPPNLLEEVNDYIEYLTFKSSQKDWANDLDKEQISLIEKGKNDLEENRFFSHMEARERIKNYIQNKSK